MKYIDSQTSARSLRNSIYFSIEARQRAQSCETLGSFLLIAGKRWAGCELLRKASSIQSENMTQERLGDLLLWLGLASSSTWKLQLQIDPLYEAARVFKKLGLIDKLTQARVAIARGYHKRQCVGHAHCLIAAAVRESESLYERAGALHTLGRFSERPLAFQESAEIWGKLGIRQNQANVLCELVEALLNSEVPGRAVSVCVRLVKLLRRFQLRSPSLSGKRPVLEFIMRLWRRKARNNIEHHLLVDLSQALRNIGGYKQALEVLGSFVGHSLYLSMETANVYLEMQEFQKASELFKKILYQLPNSAMSAEQKRVALLSSARICQNANEAKYYYKEWLENAEPCFNTSEFVEVLLEYSTVLDKLEMYQEVARLLERRKKEYE